MEPEEVEWDPVMVLEMDLELVIVSMLFNWTWALICWYVAEMVEVAMVEVAMEVVVMGLAMAQVPGMVHRMDLETGMAQGLV